MDAKPDDVVAQLGAEVRLDRLRDHRGPAGVDPPARQPAHWSSGSLLDLEFHRTSDKRVRRPLVEAALRVPGTRALAGLAPRSARRLASRGIGTGRATAIPEAVEARLRAELREDVVRLRAHAGEGFDGWGIG